MSHSKLSAKKFLDYLFNVSDVKNGKPKSNFSNTSVNHYKIKGHAVTITNQPMYGPVYYMNKPLKKRSLRDSTRRPLQKPSAPSRCSILMTPDIELVLKSNELLNEAHMQYVADHLSMNWQRFFKKMNFTQGRISTFWANNPYNVEEVRYKLLLEWKRNSKIDCSLGRLASMLWFSGEREVVKGLAETFLRQRNNEMFDNEIYEPIMAEDDNDSITRL